MAEPWAPSLADVGNRIPTKTRDQTQPGADQLLNTFTDVTVPTAAQAQPIVDNATSAVKAAVALVPPTLYSLALDAAAWRAAADIELAYPDRNADIDRIYSPLDARAKLALATFIAAAAIAGDSAVEALPHYSMPQPVPWGDQYL